MLAHNYKNVKSRGFRSRFVSVLPDSHMTGMRCLPSIIRNGTLFPCQTPLIVIVMIIGVRLSTQSRLDLIPVRFRTCYFLNDGLVYLVVCSTAVMLR